MKNKPNLPPQSRDWGSAMTQLIDETTAEANSLKSGLSVRFRGADTMAQSLVGQADLIGGAISDTQPIIIDGGTVNGVIIGTDATPVTKVTASLNVPAGYDSVILQAYGSAYVQQSSTEAGTRFPVESQIAVVSNGVTELSSLQLSPIYDFMEIRYFQVTTAYSTFRSNLGTTVSIQLRMRNGGGTAIYNNGANVANLSVLANFYKGQVLKPPA